MLTIDPVVKVNVNVSAVSISQAVFNVGAILGPSTVLKTATKRFDVYDSLEAVGAAFATTDPEYVAAQKYFGVTPAPQKLAICYYDHAASTPETPLDGLKAAIEAGMEFYGLYYIPKASETAANIKTNIVALDEYLRNTLKCGVLFYGVADTAANAVAANGIMDTLYAAKSMRSIGLLCDTSEDDAAGLMGLAMGYACANINTAFAMAYKTIGSATVKTLTQTEIDSVKAVNANVYVQRARSLYCLEVGMTAHGMRFDEILYLDRISKALQDACFDILHGAEGKLLQIDSTSELFTSEVNRILENYYAGGVLADGEWRGPALGNVETGDALEHGYAVYAAPFADQAAADRAARKGMPITVLLNMPGAIESIVLNLYVQQ